MAERTLFDSVSPVTQSVEAVKSLLAFVGRASDPLPSFVALSDGHCILVLSNSKDAYYVTTAKACSCPGHTYRPGRSCKHQRKYFPKGANGEADPDPGSLMIEAKWFGGFNGPVDPDAIKEAPK